MTHGRSPRWQRLVLMMCVSLGGSCGDRELPFAVPTLVRGHREVVVTPQGSLVPLFLGPQRKMGLCLETPLAVDTSAWEMQFQFAGRSADEEGFVSAFPKAGRNLCFAQRPPADLHSSSFLEICATLHDGFRERHYALPCFNVAYETDTSDYEARQRSVFEILGQRRQMSRSDLIATIDRLASEAETDGYPLFAIDLRLISIYELRRAGTAATLSEAEQRLAALPGWLDQPHASVYAVKADYERALVAMERGHLHQAWNLLARAEPLARRYAAGQGIAIAMKQAQILRRVGASREPLRRLEAVLDDPDWPGDPTLLPAAHGLRAWLILLDPDATAAELQRAAASLEVAAGDTATRDDREKANVLINQAFLSLRLGGDPMPVLAQANSLLAGLEPDARSRYLRGWSAVVAGLAALRSLDAERAVAACRDAAASSASPRLAGYAWSCLGQAQRLLGQPRLAEQAFEQALLRHQLANPQHLGQDLPLAPGWRADDTYRLARVAIERGEPERAWRILETLDRLSVGVESVCEGQDEVVRQGLLARRQRLFGELSLTELPSSPARRRQLESVRHSLLERLEELQRSLLSSCRRARRIAGGPADLRAFALPDEIILLQRLAGGGIRVRRTANDRQVLRSRILDLAAARQDGRIDDRAWRQLARPLAMALVPDRRQDLGTVAKFALHGLLQQVPLAALPISDSTDDLWLGQRVTPVLRPGFIESPSMAAEAAVARRPVFVIDPRLDLPSSVAGRDLYRQLFPDAMILFGDAATGSAVGEAVAQSDFLHVDAHGRYQPAFPQLSGIQLSDGLMTLIDFGVLASGSLPRRFANLSGCHTGRGWSTSDSGRYGLGGALASRGVPWVVASRGEIEDRMGHDFNRAFYRQIALGQEVPQAYAEALDKLRQHYPAAAWSNLLLVSGTADVPSRGKQGSSRTMGKLSEEVDDAT